MKKLKFYIPVLAIVCAGIVFSTTSCVDDNESQSVTDLRGAKAEQMRAEAAYKKAQAEIEKILADAQKIVAEAQAEKLKAEAELVKAQTEKEKQEWAIKIKALEKETEVAIKKAETALEEQKLALLQAQQDLLEALAKSELEDPALRAAVKAFEIATGKVNVYSDRIASNTVEKIRSEVNLEHLKKGNTEALEDLKRIKDREIARYKNDLKVQEADLKRWQDLLATPDVENIQKEIDKAKASEKVLLFTEIPGLETKRLQARIVLDNAISAWNEFRDAANNWRTGNVYTVAELDVVIAELNAYLTQANADKTKADADFSDATSKLVGLHTAYKNAETARETAYTALEKAQNARQAVYGNPSSTQAQKDAADTAVTTAETAYNAAVVTENDKRDKYYEGQQKVTNAQNAVESTTDYINSLTREIAAKVKVKALYKDESTPATIKAAYDKAQTEYIAAYNAKDLKVKEANSLKYYYQTLEYAEFNKDRIEQEIEILEDAIAQTTTGISQAERDIQRFEADNTKAVGVAQNNIDRLTREIEQDQLLLDAAQKDANKAKAIIESKTTNQ